MKKLAIALAAIAVAATVASAAVYSQNAVGFINVTVAANEIVALTIPFNDINTTEGTVLFKNTQMANDAASGSVFYYWDGTGWKGVSKGRNGFATDYALKPGEMFMFKPADAQIITMNGEVPDEAELEVSIKGQGNYSSIGNPYPVPTKFKTSALADKAETGAVFYYWDGTGWKGVSKGRNGFATEYEVQPGEGFFFKTTTSEDTKVWKVTKEYDFP